MTIRSGCIRAGLLRLIPVAACFAVAGYGLLAWFQLDDFLWLRMPQTARESGFWIMLTNKTPYGTWRPLSEQLLFFTLDSLWPNDALPFRLLVFGTQLANLWLLGSLAARLWQRRSMVWLAPLLWTINAALALPMVWSSSYNQPLCTLVLLIALRLFVSWLDGGRRRHFFLAATSFVVGLLVLESEVVFPALATAWVLTTLPRDKWKRPLLWLLPLYLVSAAFGLTHALERTHQPGVYGYHPDGQLLVSLWRYWRWSLVPPHWIDGHPLFSELLLVALFSGALVAFVIHRLRRGDRRPLFGLAWFLLTLAPLLPLTEHVADYYLFVPTAGLSMTLAGAVVEAWQRRRARWVAAAGLALFVCIMSSSSFVTIRGLSTRTFGEKRAMLALFAERQRDPTHALLLGDVNEATVRLAIGYEALTAMGIRDVYLTPELADRIHQAAPWHPMPELTPSRDVVAALLLTHRARVLNLCPDGIVDITSQYSAAALATRPGAATPQSP